MQGQSYTSQLWGVLKILQAYHNKCEIPTGEAIAPLKKTDKCLSSLSKSTNVYKNEALNTNIYNNEACNLSLLEICPSVHNSVQFSQNKTVSSDSWLGVEQRVVSV